MNQRQRHKEYTVHYFAKVARFYDLAEILLHFLRKRVAAHAGKPCRILDVACGTGSQAIALARKGHVVVGIDLSPVMLDRAKKKMPAELSLEFVQGDAADMKFMDSAFDASTISLALHDMPAPIALAILSEMKRVTRKGGKIIIVDYNQPSNIPSRIFLKAARSWETKHYSDFIKTGLSQFLEAVQLPQARRSTYLLGIIQIVECVNQK